MSNTNIQDMQDALTPDIYARLKTAVEIRKWPNGLELSQEQIETCMQAIIAYEAKHLPAEQRTGYVPPKATLCEDKTPPAENSTPLKWR